MEQNRSYTIEVLRAGKRSQILCTFLFEATCDIGKMLSDSVLGQALPAIQSYPYIILLSYIYKRVAKKLKGMTSASANAMYIAQRC